MTKRLSPSPLRRRRLASLRRVGKMMSLLLVGGLGLAETVAAQEPCSWSPVADGVTNGAVYAFTPFDDGAGEALYAGGSFTSINGLPANAIARWDGRSWSALDAGVDGPVRSLAVFDDGSGPALYVGGSFESAGGEAVLNIARWDGRAWSAVGEGLENADGDTWVHALEVFDDGSGAKLHAGGRFTRSGKAALNHLARWNGEAWESVGGGVNSTKTAPAVGALLADVDMDSPTLYVGGTFDHAGAVAANNIARWDGTAWHALQFGIQGPWQTFVASLAIRPAGGANELYVGGSMTTAGTVLALQVARWDGETWSSLDSSISGSTAGNIYALRLFDDGHGMSLFAGGLFMTSNPEPISMRHIARWHLCPLPPTILRVPEEYSTIQQAILAAEDGNEIHVAPGVYTEAIDFLGRDVVIRSEDGPEVTIIDGDGISGSLVTFTSGEGPGARLEGFTVTGGGATAGGGLRVSGGAQPTVVRCRFVENAATTGGAVSLTSGRAPAFINCIFEGNTSASGSAISATGTALTLTRCSFFDNIASVQATVHLVGGEAAITEAAFLGNTAPSAAAMLISGANVSVTDSAVVNNTSAASGAIVSAGGDLTISGTRFCTNESGDITGAWTDGGGNTFLNECVTGRVVHVPADFATIQAAIDWSLTGFEVVVAPGEYNEAIDFNGRAITLRSSGGPEVTIIDGSDMGNLAVRFHSGEGRDTVIEGFTVMNRWFGANAVIHVSFASAPVIRNCTILNEHTFAFPFYGGLVIAGGSSPLVVDCEVRENGGGGGVYVYQSKAELINCLIEDNASFNGGGVEITVGCDVVMRDCTVRFNKVESGGGGLMLMGMTNVVGVNPAPSTLKAIDCRFEDNSSIVHSGGGGIGIYHGTASFINCTIVGNDAVYSGGVVIWSLADVEFISCRIADNVSTGYQGGGIRIGLDGWPSVVRLVDCEIANNIAPDTGGAITTGAPHVSILENTLICGNTPEQIDGDYIDEGGNVITDLCLAADLNRDGVVNVFDLQVLLAAWGACPDSDCPADLSGDGAVNVVDLLILLADWT